jgi:hypothetical protein
MTTKAKPRAASEVLVSPATEWTDFRGVLLLFGLRRSTAYHLDKEGLIKSVSLRHENETRGKRLFHVPSIREYLNSKLENEQPAAAEKSENSLGTL